MEVEPRIETPEETTMRVRIPAVSIRKVINTLAHYSVHDEKLNCYSSCKNTAHFRLQGAPDNLIRDLGEGLQNLEKAEIVEKDGRILFKGHSDFVVRESEQK